MISEFVDINSEDIAFLNFKAYKNDTLIQQGSYDLMIYKPQQIIDFLQQSEISICENDLLITGTPKGVGVVNIGDRFKIELFCKDKKILATTF